VEYLLSVDGLVPLAESPGLFELTIFVSRSCICFKMIDIKVTPSFRKSIMQVRNLSWMCFRSLLRAGVLGLRKGSFISEVEAAHSIRHIL
jgi:hypothetical protein